MTNAHGLSAAERHRGGWIAPCGWARWKDPLTGRWHPPLLVLMWGQSYVCVFPQDASDLQWLPECFV